MQRMAGGAELVWCVVQEEVPYYRRAGARLTITVPIGKARAVNRVLDRFGADWCVCSDDDCQGLWQLGSGGRALPMTLNEAAQAFVTIGTARRDALVTITHVTNRAYLNREVSDWGQTVGWFFAVAPLVPDRLDPSLPLGEDLDFAARICTNYGRVSRPNWIQGDYRVGDKESHFNHRVSTLAFQVLCERYPLLFRGYDATNIYYRALPAPPRRAAPRRRLRRPTPSVSALGGRGRPPR